ncbi:hypothetical protein LOD99_1495 [Oopsacas minuta]|uniref:Uncharacterized protein n=1 Tax=Oopsacas minuta TaxID=111878 RepID=A0AAV7K4L9_9METZ|nr:hypothetical protein LOD99_1495 [Oopsacas minuta]
MASKECRNSPDSYCYYLNVKGRRALTYPSTPSSIAPVPHSETLPVPKPPANLEFNTECEGTISSETSDAEEEYPQSTSAEHHYPSKRELDDFIRDLQLTNLQQSYRRQD